MLGVDAYIRCCDRGARGNSECGGALHLADKAKHRCRRATALTLIDPSEYASAENVYAGDCCIMADELDVTSLVLQDYQEILDDESVPVRLRRIKFTVQA